MCRALKVLCVAPDRDALATLKRATVSADWELTAGATDEATALEQLHEDRPHILVVFGDGFDAFVARALDAYPGIRVVADHDVEGVTEVVTGADAVRNAVLGRPRPGPVT